MDENHINMNEKGSQRMKPEKSTADSTQLNDQQMEEVVGGLVGNGKLLCTVEGAPLRSSPYNAPNNVITTMKKQERVTLVGRNENGFVLISYKGIKGWASSTHIG